MTENEVKEKLQAYLECQKKKAAGIYEQCNKDLCDNCELCYAQGTTGEHIDSVESAIKALEEVQQYREYREKFKGIYGDGDNALEVILDLLLEYEIKEEKGAYIIRLLTDDDAKKWDEYRAIGTVEECRAAREKQTARVVIDNIPTDDDVWYQCPACKADLTHFRGFYCQCCGQKLKWRDEE